MGLVAGILNGFFSGFGLAFVTAKVLPYVFDREDPISTGQLVIVILMIPGIAALRALTGFISMYFMSRCNQRICLRLRYELMEEFQALSLSYFQRQRSGGLMARVMNDTQRVSSVITKVAADMIRQPVTVLAAFGGIVYLSYQQRELGIIAVSFLLLPLIIAPIRLIGRKVASSENRMGESEGGLQSAILENISSVREIRAFNLHKLQLDRFYQRAEQQHDIILNLAKLRGLISPGVEILSAFGVAAAIFYATKKGIGLEALAPLLIALYMCYDPFKKIGVIYADIKRASLAVMRIEKVFHSKERLTVENPEHFSGFSDSIEFRDVTFRYRQKLALHSNAVKIKKGEIVALVGQSGAGKSTFCNLLGRYYDPTRGDVFIDGINMRSIEESVLREHMAFVPQDCFLFAESIMENIRYGRLSATDEEVIESARAANADEFIRNTQKGYDTVVAERGASLSGGQRQRIAIARAFLRNAEILVLDEATSALDNDSESKVQAAVQRLMQDKTVVIIAHRFSTIQMASRVLLFKEGRIVDDGTVDELLERSEEFRRFKEFGEVVPSF